MAFRIKIEFEGIPQEFRGGNPRLVIIEEMLRGVNEADVLVKNVMVANTPFGGTGLTRDGWLVQPARATIGKVVGRVVNPTPAAAVLESGARPHHPPVGPDPALGVWIRRTLRISSPKKIRQKAFEIGAAFKRRGIRKRRIFSRAFRGVEPFVRAVLEIAAGRVVKRLG